MSTSIACPVCGQVDQVRKVTTIVDEALRSALDYYRRHRNEDNYDRHRNERRRRLPPLPVELRKSLILAERLRYPSRWLKKQRLLHRLWDIETQGPRYLKALAQWIEGLLYPLTNGRIEQEEEELRQEERALEKYTRLYYCYRDDVVFVPGENGFASPKQLHTLLYQ